MIRRPNLETKINHERWLVSYADFITLLFAFFVVMYSVSQVNESKYRVLSDTLEAAFKAESQLGGGESDLPTQNIAELDVIAQDVKSKLGGLIDDDTFVVSGNEQWVDIELPANLLFETGKAELNDQANDVLRSVAESLAPFENAVAIAGHTDDVPIRNSRYQNNWALSSARAVAVVDWMAYQGVNPERLSAVGYGEYRPVGDNATEEGRARNRRVVLRVAKEAVAAAPVAVEEFEGEIQDASTDEESQQASDTNLSDNAPVNAPPTPEPAVAPVRLQGGGLLFSSDPNLPRNNPPAQETPSPDPNAQ